HELVGQLRLDTIERAIALDGAVDGLSQLLLSHNFDVPAGEFACQPDVLPAATDGQRELILTDQHNRSTKHLAENHLLDTGRLERIRNEHFEVIVPTDNVDPLASELIHDILDAVTAHADASADAIDTSIARRHRHLGPVTWLACHGANLDHAIGNLR